MRLNLWILCLATSLAVAATAEAQPAGGRRSGPGGVINGYQNVGPVGIAGHEAVQKELALSAEATAKVKAVLEEFNTAARESMTSWQSGVGPLRDMTREERTAAMAKRAEMLKATADKFLPKLKEVLTADQFTRLQQITWQSMGTAALSDPEVVEAIPVSKEQQDKIKSINTEYAAKKFDLFTESGVGRVEPLAYAKMQIHNTEQDKERDAKISEVLTKEQQDKFASLKGKEFDLSPLRGFRGRGDGGPGRGGGGSNGARPKRPQPEAQ